ncbi:MAG: SurA N-terminal domain-containing protein, partial [Acidobacteria bacterium]|nr:SurA N-terminal domain-containing protein [Acidobacteriota bacterium]
MLDLGGFRRKKGVLKWVLWLVIIGLGASMAFLFVQTPTGLVGGLGTQEVAIVAGKSITLAEFRRRYGDVYDSFRQRSPSAVLDPDILKLLGLDQEAINGLVSEYVMDYVADKFGLQVVPEEIAENITTSPAFQDNGQFIGSVLYQQILQANNYSTAEFEESVRREILAKKLSQVLTDGIQASSEEVRQEFLSRNQEIKIRYIAIDPEEERPQDVDEEDLRTYFEERKDNYRSLEQRQIKYVAVPIEPDQVELTEEQITERMASIAEKDEVEARHILISSTTPEAAEKGEEILQQLRVPLTVDRLLRRLAKQTTIKVSGEDVVRLCDDATRRGLTMQSRIADLQEWEQRQKSSRRRGITGWFRRGVFVRIPLIRPDAFLTRTVDRVSVLASPAALALYVFISLVGIYFLVQRFDAYQSTFPYFFNASGVVVFALVIVAVKTIHEFSHAYVAKALGNRVPTMGVVLIFLFPVAYADVTDSWRMRSRKKRLLISLAGVMAELILAGLALFLWALSPPGPVKSVCFVISSVTL